MAIADNFNQSVQVNLLQRGDQGAQPTDPVGSPKWWANELEIELTTRNGLIELYEDYYAGRHKLSFASSQFRAAFASMLSAVSDNWIPLVINASVERLNSQGFTFGDSQDGDNQAWDIWQRSHMDADAPLAYTEACKHGESYLLIWPVDESEKRGVFGRFFSKKSGETPPMITVEHPSQMIVRRSAGNRREIEAAFKCWVESDGRIMGTLYLPDATYRMEKTKKGWVERPGVDAQSVNRLGIVPVVPMTNDPHMLGCRPPASILAAPHGAPDVVVGLGRSDQADIISTVDQINKLLCDMLVSSEVAAYKQRWATGLEVPRDEVTGNPIEPFKSAVDRLWIAEGEDGANVRFGEFTATDLKNYTGAMESRVQSLAARTRTPPHYLLGSIVNVSGDALVAAETGLSSKVRGKSKPFGEGQESALRIAFAWMGDDRARDLAAETKWAPFESRSESEYVDSLVKKMAIGVPKEQLWEDAGYSPQQIGRFKTMLLEEGMRTDIFGVQSPATKPAVEEPPTEDPTNGLPVS